MSNKSIPATAAATTTTAASSVKNNSTFNNRPSMSGMDSLSVNVVNTERSPTKRTNKFGGFFSRLANFRFSARKKPETNVIKPEINNKPLINENKESSKVDYIYIPLKDPNVNNNANDDNNKKLSDIVVSSGKPPPVPKMPPKIVGASVKKRHAQNVDEPDFTRNCIDSGTTCPMEQMGLIETDLDTEVTVITSGAHVKTRSLMNLGADAPQKCLITPTVQTRPHKSMEFLLDKQNLKVVEVSFVLFL